jgi:phage shock protein PspC (stress-responsive transcriptional regulator)
MEKVVAINLNGRAYHVEEPAYAALVAYLDRAAAQLASDPDRAEILRDLEQAIAEKCDRLLGPQKTVVTAEEVGRILAEMGPVETGDGTSAPGQEHAAADDRPRGAAAAKRLYQIREGAMISGVCAGLAAFLDIDVTLVRVAFVILAIVTKGVWLLAYGIMMFVIPYAETAEQRAAASGQPFSAQDLIDQAKRNFADFKTNKDWRRHWRRQQRDWYRRWRYATTAPHGWQAPAAYASQVWVHTTAPFFGLINAALALTMVFALFSLATTQAVFGIPLPAGVPLWAGFVVVIGLYQMLASPFVAAQRAGRHGASGLAIWMAPINTLVWFAAIGFSIWYGYHHVPAVHDALETVLTTLRQAADQMHER